MPALHGMIKKRQPRSESASAEQVLAELTRPGRDVAFIDETGTHGKPLAVLAGDFCLMCAVVVPSESYQFIKTTILNALHNFQSASGVREFHANEIVNPSSQSAWKKVSLADRLGAFDLMSNLLIEVAKSILYVYVSGEQYFDELAPQIQAAGEKEPSHKKALEKVFFKALLGHLEDRGETIPAIVVDSTTALPNGIHAIRNTDNVYAEGILHADSRMEEGLQLADLAAYTLNRVFHVKQRQLDGKLGRFDAPIQTLYWRMQPKMTDLLVSP